ncbi:sugar ABC transporter ATP-binding protein [Diplocloster agilis]|uniref:Sugar ABC transporter ATP-binding protein n=1 Tax=Diplocloster agilis TaxID=2850323 RepID=A0A949NBQ8_9FIRM|nr:MULTISPECIES: sugar ABC transporter ATP-binding protein [Lachnospiraceae]MBU9737852.1 sugar ABC transporter ATP-binding protein [Diplocloster agilis]MCU6736761.1 sugar ABC transporter ATP-binding protein [Suonthocola fibrivorans]SCJ93444.1 Ribose import ATP-binding protein RbsA [uncultured Clostridium sp.]
MNDAVVLEMKNITKRFPGVLALDKVQLTLHRGEVHVLLGENGAGKSTLIKTITGAYIPDEGEIFLEGKPVRFDSPLHAQKLGISAVYQEFNLIPELDAAKNIFLGKELMVGKTIKLNSREMYRKSEEYLETIGAKLNPRIPIKNLGVAAQQMVEIAKAIATDCKILILDEPTAVLTNQEIDRLFQVVETLTKRGVAIIFISHRLEEINRIGDRVTVMRDGAYVDTIQVEKGKLDTDYLVKLMVGREITNKFPKINVAIGEEILRVEHLNRKNVLKDINLTLHAGEILGIGGLVGAGRTEAVKAIFGADPIDSGEITVFGKKALIRQPKDAIRLGIGLAPEDRKVEGLNLGMSIKDNIIMASVDKISRCGVIGRRKRTSIPEGLKDNLRIVTPSINQMVGNLSGGNQQKVVLAKWLASDSRIVIFDEPTRGIDVGAKVEVYQLMNQLISRGVGIIMISSELPELLAMSDRILVMHEGRITGELSHEEASQEKVLRLASGGI